VQLAVFVVAYMLIIGILTPLVEQTDIPVKKAELASFTKTCFA